MRTCGICRGEKIFETCPGCGSSSQGAAIVLAPKDLGPKKPAGDAKRLPREILIPAFRITEAPLTVA